MLVSLFDIMIDKYWPVELSHKSDEPTCSNETKHKHDIKIQLTAAMYIKLIDNIDVYIHWMELNCILITKLFHLILNKVYVVTWLNNIDINYDQ